MDVVIVWCKECVFSQNALTGIRSCLEKMAGGLDGQEGILLKPQCFDLHDLHHNTIAVTVRKAKVRMVILTHFFLDHLKASTVKSSCQMHLNRILYSEGVIAILTGIRQQEIIDNYLELLPHFTTWSILELKSKRKPDSQFFKAFSEQVFRSYNMNTKHNEVPLRPASLINGHGVSGYRSMINLDLTCNCDPDSQKMTIKINQKIHPLDEVTLQIQSGDVTYVGVIQIPSDSTTREEFSVEIPTASSNLKPLVVHQEDDPIDAMIAKFPGYKKYLDEQVADKLLLCFEVGKSIEDLKLLNEMRRGKADHLPTLMHFAAYYGLEQTVLNLLERGNGLELCEIENKFGETPLTLTTRRGYGATIGQTMRDYEEIMVSCKAIDYMRKYIERIDAEKTAREQNAVDGAEAVVTDASDEASEASSTHESVASAELLVEQTEDTTVRDPPLPVKPPRAAPPSTVRPRIVPPNENESAYDYPPTARPIDFDYDRPPSARPVRPPKKRKVLEKKDGTIQRDANDYIPVIGQNTLQRSIPDNLSFRKSLDSYTTSSSDEEEPGGYNKEPPKPQIPGLTSPNTSGISTTESSPNRASFVVIQPRTDLALDAKNEELRQLMEQVRAKMIDINDLEGIFAGWKRRSDVKQDIVERQKELKRIREEYDAAQTRRSTKDVKFLERITAVFRGRKKTVPQLQISAPTLIYIQGEGDPTQSSSSTTPQQSSNFSWPNPKSSIPNEDSNMRRTGSDRRRIAVSYNETPLELPVDLVVNLDEPVVVEATTEAVEDCTSSSDGSSRIEVVDPDSTVNDGDIDNDAYVDLIGTKRESTPSTRSPSRDRDPTPPSKALPIPPTEEPEPAAPGIKESLTPPPRPPKKKKDRSASEPKNEQPTTKQESAPADEPQPLLSSPDQPVDTPPSPRPRRNQRVGMKLQYINYGNMNQPAQPPPAGIALPDGGPNNATTPDYENQTMK